ncbi:hypothetical protein CBR_g34945 [Chara braunii]|uniref:Uncharacterized protein n=1 Tax=Chara braunii TaxID=69332 RepID=A0A388LJS4_CHABU|nr:hypothetical protein CBR_g34945 [Chara braunii]|eukprot:GBG82569.1 hypothetical protein CBR_g34945 [Chara braunii]
MATMEEISERELHLGANEWLVTLEKGRRWLHEIVGDMSLGLQMEPEVEGGAISLAGWMKDKSEDMMEIIWELEEGPDPRLDICIDWRRADGIMAVCKTLFNEGRDLYDLLEDRLESVIDREEAHVAMEVTVVTSRPTTTSITTTTITASTSTTITTTTITTTTMTTTTNTNHNNNGHSDNKNSGSINNNNYFIISMETYFWASEVIISGMGEMSRAGMGETGVVLGSSRVESGASQIIDTMLGERPQADVVGIGDNNNNNNNDEGGSNYDGSSDYHVSSATVCISRKGERLHADVEGIGVDTDKKLTILLPFLPFNLIVCLRIGVG